jgi:hypothetical protein
MALTRVSVATRCVGAVVALIAAVTAPLDAQEVVRRPPPRPEVRVDYLGSNPHAVHAGLGLNVPVGTYLRLGVIGAGGTAWVDGSAGASARGDVIGRFVVDPFREHRWGLSAGGGLSVRYDRRELDDRARWRLLVAVVLDLEGPRLGSVAPALQLGLGGGLRAGLSLRGADPSRR